MADDLDADYYLVGVCFGISMLQGGPLPVMLSEECIDYLFGLKPTTSSTAVTELGRGLEKLNFLSFFKQFPILRHLLQREKKSLRPIQLLKLFDVRYSEAGSTAFNRQKTIFSLFTKYVREVASGKRPPQSTTAATTTAEEQVEEVEGKITWEKILVFATGMEDEPLMGFFVKPTGVCRVQHGL